MATKFAPLMW